MKHRNPSYGSGVLKRDVVCYLGLLVLAATFANGQDSTVLAVGNDVPADSDASRMEIPGAAGTNSPVEPESKRILWVIPNFRTAPTMKDFKPLTPREKFKIAAEDGFDRGTFALAAVFAGQGQLTNANRSFGQGAAGYARYFGTSYGDFLIGDYMTEAVFPTLLHQDPRYFRRGTGSGWSRLRYAVGQTIVTHGDSGKTQFNFSEIVGNSAAAAISMAYYPDNRTATDGVSKLGMQIGVDMAANVLKEFWPELQRKFSRKRGAAN